jgi:TRAP-type C4-dicarboxylate transport system permease small subunit
MSDLPPPDGPAPARDGPLFFIGAAGLLIAMATDTVAVIGRHVAHPLLGSIEIVQAAILLAACAAMLTATLRGAHAVVHLVVDRLSPAARDGLARLSHLLSALLFLGFAAGSAWLTSDLWGGHEESDLLHLPYLPLRLVATVTSLAIALVFLLRAVQPRRRA